MTPYQHGFADGYADLPCDKSAWWESAEAMHQYTLGKQLGILEAKLEAQQHNERHTYD
jgi:hypothetical protein